MGKLSRDKGAAWEREVARRLGEATPGAEVKRGIGQSRGGGREVADVVHPLFHVECKVGARPPLLPALEQAERDAAPGKHPVAVCRVNRGPGRPKPLDVVVMGLDDWLEVVGLLWRNQRGGA